MVKSLGPGWQHQDSKTPSSSLLTHVCGTPSGMLMTTAAPAWEVRKSVASQNGQNSTIWVVCFTPRGFGSAAACAA